MINIEFTYTAKDFDTSKPYQDLLSIEDPFQRQITEEALTAYAKSLKISTFKRRLRQYIESQKTTTALVKSENEITAFEDQEIELDSGDWKTSENGVWRNGPLGGIEIACPHPITIKARLKNIDTCEVKLVIRFRRGSNSRKTWIDVPVGQDILANAKNIVSLAQIGIAVTSGKRAQSLVDYLDELHNRNYDIIPEMKSVSRLGWNEEGFSPYQNGIVFDGNGNFQKTFDAIGPHGSSKAWLEEVLQVRKYSITVRIILAASLASVLIEPLGCLPFFVHLWGMDSGTGKTVALMLAASIWGNPAVGGPYLTTFKSTAVGTEVLAGFLNSLPVILDELQLARDNRGRINFNVYELGSGSGKLRSNKSLGLSPTPTWSNCFITSGETPLVGDNDGAGALSRVIEVECKADAKVVEDGHRTANVLKANYGHAGKEFVYRLQQPTAPGRDDTNMSLARSLYESYFTACLKCNAVDKQAHSAALILTADSLAENWIFRDGLRLTPEDIAEYLRTADTVSAANRGYAYMCDWVVQNGSKLKGSSDTEFYGLIDAESNKVYILRNVFFSACENAGISPKALLSHLKSKGLIDTYASRRNFTISKSINGVKTEYVAMHLPKQDGDIPSGDGDSEPL